MDQVLERRSAPETVSEVEATLNYLVDDGVKIFTEAGGAGALDVRGGTIDPRLCHGVSRRVRHFAGPPARSRRHSQ